MNEMPDVDPTETPDASVDRTETTGDQVIDQALERLEALDGRPVQEHPAEFEAIHRVLRDTLSGQRQP